MSKITELHNLKKGEHFKFLDIKGNPEANIYIKGESHKEHDIFYCGIIFRGRIRKMFSTYIYAPGKPYNNDFTGYVDYDIKVLKL